MRRIASFYRLLIALRCSPPGRGLRLLLLRLNDYVEVSVRIPHADDRDSVRELFKLQPEA